MWSLSAVGGRRESHDLYEGTVEITDIVEANQGCNIGYFFICGTQEFACLDDAYAVQIFKRRTARKAAEIVTVIAFAVSRYACKLGQGQCFGIMLLHIVHAKEQIPGKGVARCHPSDP